MCLLHVVVIFTALSELLKSWVRHWYLINLIKFFS